MEKRDLVIALHGFLGKPQDWDLQLKPYSKTAQKIITPSLFEAGDWSPHQSITEWGDFFLATCEKWRDAGYNLKLFAYSLGGRLALGPYLKNPELFTEAHFLSVNPGLQNSAESLLRKSSDDNWARKFLNDPWQLVLRDWNSQSVFLGDPEPERKECDFSRELLALALTKWSLSQQENYWKKLTTLTHDLNWWVGQKDLKFISIAKQLNKENPKIKLKIIPNCGHRILFASND